MCDWQNKQNMKQNYWNICLVWCRILYAFRLTPTIVWQHLKRFCSRKGETDPTRIFSINVILFARHYLNRIAKLTFGNSDTVKLVFVLEGLMLNTVKHSNDCFVQTKQHTRQSGCVRWPWVIACYHCCLIRSQAVRYCAQRRLRNERYCQCVQRFLIVYLATNLLQSIEIFVFAQQNWAILSVYCHFFGCEKGKGQKLVANRGLGKCYVQ